MIKQEADNLRKIIVNNSVIRFLQTKANFKCYLMLLNCTLEHSFYLSILITSKPVCCKFFRNPRKARELEQQIRNRQVLKEYVCRVEGEFPP
jgi:hypothetical protein